MNYSLHTVELRKYLTSQEYSNLFSKLYKESKGAYRVVTDAYGTHFHRFKGRGIGIRMFEEKFRQYIAIKLSLNCLMNGKESVELIRHEDIPAALEIADNNLIDYLGAEFGLEKFVLWRVDFCVNINVESAENVTAYIKQMYKTQARKSYKIRGLKNTDINKNTGFTAVKYSGSEIAIYDKYHALIDIGDDQADRAKSILRIEFRLLNRKMVDEYISGDGVCDKIMRSAVAAESIIKDFMESFCMNADYYKLKEAEDIVSYFVQSSRMRNRMIRMLELTAKLHSVRLAKKTLLDEDKKISHDYFNRMMEEFAEIGVNVVTLSKNGKVDYLPSLFRYLYEK